MMPSRLALALLVLAPVGAGAQPAQRAAAEAPTPTLVVFLTVDQLRTDYLDRWPGQLTGGLARLRDRGAFFVNAVHDHATTETAPGHAATMSGRHPAHTGIVRNNAGVADPQSPLLNGSRGWGASPYRFRGTVLFDWLRIRDARSRALSVSRKDRGAILPLGRAKQSVFWYSGVDGGFTTSTYYADTLPAWVRRANARHNARHWAGRTWDLLLPASAYAEPDSVPPESNGRDFTFPHRVPDDSAAAARTFAEYPFMDDLTAAFALEGVRALELGAGPQTDVLAVSFSTTDAVGHRYGPDSREIHDQVLRVDRVIGAFLDSLYAMRDSTRIVVALTSDHGVAPIPEVHFAGQPGAVKRANLNPLVDSTARALARHGLDTLAFDFEYGMVFVDRARFARAGVNADSVIAGFLVRARRIPGVLRADRRQALARADTTRDAIARRWLHSLPSDLQVAAIVTLRPYVYWAPGGRPETWTIWATHGSPHDYDARVPVIFYGAPFRAGRYTRRARVVDMAPTLAAVLGVTPAEALDGRVLREALRAPRAARPAAARR